MKNKVEIVFEELYLKGIVVLEKSPSRINLSKVEKLQLNKFVSERKGNNWHLESWQSEALSWLSSFQDITEFKIEEDAKWYLIGISGSVSMFKIHVIYNIFHIHYLGLDVLNRSVLKDYIAIGVFDEEVLKSVNISSLLDDFMSLKLFFMRPPSKHWEYNRELIEYSAFKINGYPDIEYHTSKKYKKINHLIKVSSDPFKDIQSCILPFNGMSYVNILVDFTKNTYWKNPVTSDFTSYYTRKNKLTHYLNFESNRMRHFNKMAKQFLKYFEWIASRPNRFPLDEDELHYLFKLKSIKNYDYNSLVEEINSPIAKEAKIVLDEYSDNFFKLNDRLKLMFLFTSTNLLELRVNFFYMLIISRIMEQEEFDETDFYNYYSKLGFLGADTLQYLKEYQPNHYGINLLEQTKFASLVMNNSKYMIRKNTDLYLNIREMLANWETI